ncbi:MAG: MlaD family protein [Candidatus Obscuribacter sp.]|nr:MCE family protein [Candidatus Melainabacteria bacterium]MDX1988312.1 MlaD family protein [Candidatus Obscuribacter sp.]
MNSKPNLEIRVGLFFVIAMFMLTIGWSWLKGVSINHPPQRFSVVFSDIAGLNNNAPVNINGVRVGTVEKIELLQPDSAGKSPPSVLPKDDLSRQSATTQEENSRAMVNCQLKINTEAVTIPVGSTITIQTQGLVGAKYIEITLPEFTPGKEVRAISAGETVRGQDPIRTELVLNRIATKLNDIVTSVGSEEVGVSLADALKHSGEAVSAFNQAAKKLDKNMDRFEKAADSFTDTTKKVGEVAQEAKSAVRGANGFFHKGEEALGSMGSLARDVKVTNSKVGKILDNPGLSADLKDTVNLAKQTADSIGVTIHELNGTLANQPLRQDLITMLTRLNESVNSIERSVKTVDKLAEDQELRSDIKKVVSDARLAMDKVENLVNEPDFKSDLKGTIARVKDAAGNVDTAAQQLQQVLDKPAPLMHMLFGRPGKLAPKSQSAGNNTYKTR